MKSICLLFLATLAYTSAGSLGSVPTSALLALIENVREQMPCGFPKSNIPPLAPLKISQKSMNIDTADIKVQSKVEDLVLNGLNDFDINELNINAIRRKVSMDLVFNNIHLDNLYELNALIKQYNATINIVGEGSASPRVSDLRIKINSAFKMNVSKGTVSLKNFKVVISVGDIVTDLKGILGNGNINEYANDFLADAVKDFINDNADMITNQIEEKALPVINAYLADVSISDLINSGNGTSVHEPCIPPM